MLQSLFITGVLASALPAILIAPHAAMLIWAWISYMNPHKMAAGFVVSLPLLDIVAGMTFLGWLTSRDRKLPPAHPVLFAMVMFFIWVCATTLLAVNEEMATEKFITFSKILLFTIFALVFLTTENRIRHFIYVILLSLCLYSVKGGIFTILNGGQYNVYGPPNTFLGDNNQLALAFLTVVPLFFWVFKHGEHRLIRYGAIGAGLTTLVAILGSQSRGALVSLIALFGWMFVRSRQVVLGLLLAATVGITAYFVMPQEWVDRMETISEYESDESSSTRLKMWKYSLNVANGLQPFGGGFNFFFDQGLARQYMPPSTRIFVAHSIYFDTLGEHGYVGLFLYLLIFACALVTCREVKKITKDNPEVAWAFDLARMLEGCLLAFAVGGAFLSLSIFDLYYHILALTACTHFAVTQKLSPQSKTMSMKDLLSTRGGGRGALPAE